MDRRGFLKTCIGVAATTKVFETPVFANIGDDTPQIHNNLIIEFKKQKEFFDNWYENRIIPDPNLQIKYKEVKSHILERLKTKFLELSLPNNVSNNTTGLSRNDTIYINPDVLPNDSTVYAHENAHHIFPTVHDKNESNMIKQDMPIWMIDIIENAVSYSRPDDNREFTLDFNLAKRIESYRRPDETYARICVLRYLYKLLPNKILLDSDLDIIYKENLIKNENTLEVKNENIYQLLYIIKRNLLLELLNKLP